MKKKIHILIYHFLFVHFVFSQNTKTDSLRFLLKKDNPDTNKITHLNLLSREYINIATYDSALHYANLSLAAIEKILSYPEDVTKNVRSTLMKSKSSAWNNIGIVYKEQGDYTRALDYYLKALKIDEELKDKRGMAKRVGNIGNVYRNQGDYSKASDYYFRALKINEDLGNKSSIAIQLGNIGLVYENQGEVHPNPVQRELFYNKALDYYFKALKMDEKLENKNGIARHLGNIGVVYHNQGEVHQNTSQREKLYNKALEYYFKALKMDEELGNKNGIARHLDNIGSLYSKQKKYVQALDYTERAQKLAHEIGAMDLERECEQTLYEIYKVMGNSAEALAHYEKGIVLKDTIFAEEKQKELVRKAMNYEFEKKEDAAKATQEKKDAVQKSEDRKQKIVLLLTSGFLIVVILFAGFIFRALRVTQKQKLIISQTNKNITDSINYAKRIQDAIIPSQEEVSKHFSDYFIFFRPREIVSGDFYWLSHQNGKTIFAVADCTGHGVPGAFMSMIGNTLLNEIVNEKNICEPNKILNHLNEGIVRALHQESRSQDDGMDISICLFDKEKNKITFAGANHSLYIARNGSIEEIKGDIYSIGSMFGKKAVSFSQKEFYPNKNSTLYFSTDGFSDQTGGAKGRKFLVKHLQNLLADVSSLGIKEQEEKITKAFEEWKGTRAQLDDVLLVGIKI